MNIFVCSPSYSRTLNSLHSDWVRTSRPVKAMTRQRRRSASGKPPCTTGTRPCRKAWKPASTGICQKRAWKSPAARRRKSRWPGHCTKGLRLSCWMSPPPPWIPLPKPRSTPASAVWWRIGRRCISATGFPPASSVMRLPCLTKAGSSSREPTRSCWRIRKANTGNSGMPRHSIMLNNKKKPGAGLQRRADAFIERF